jgi:transposase-like protein
VSNIQEQVLGLTKLKPKADETAEDFTRRNVKRLHGLSDRDWEALPDPVQAWVNDNMIADEKEQPFTDLLQLPEEDVTDPEPELSGEPELVAQQVEHNGIDEEDDEAVAAEAEAEQQETDDMRGKKSVKKSEEAPRTRRTFSDEQKCDIVAESFGDETQTAVAERHGISITLLGMWRKDKRYMPRKGAKPTQTHVEPEEEVSSPRVVRPRVEAQEPPRAATKPQHLNGAAPIEISVGSVIVRIPVGADDATIQTAIRIVQQVGTSA